MMQVIEIFISGVSQGAVYCLIAVGLSLVYGTSRILNFAHGSLYSMGGYLAWFLTVGYFGLPLWVAVVIAIPLLFTCGVGLERLLIRPLRRTQNWKVNTIMVTLGLAFILDNSFQILFGPTTKMIPAFIEGTVNVGGISLSHYKIWMFFVSIGLVVSLEYFLSQTRFGHAVRAVSQDMQGAEQVGINVNQVFGFAFGLSVVLTGLAGIMLAPVFLISPLGGWGPFLKAFVIVVLGGLGSTKGAFVAAFLLGINEAFVIFYLGAHWAMPAWLAILLIVLMVRPKGLFGVWDK